MTQYTVEKFVEHFLVDHEGSKVSRDPEDSGNFYKGVLVGSKYGVTGAALAAHANRTTITAADIAGLTLAEAADIALTDYYDAPHLDLLGFDPVVASVFDMGYNAGPSAAIKLLQRQLGFTGDDVDGRCGQGTAEAYYQFRISRTLEEVAKGYRNQRVEFYEDLISRKPSQAKYRNGWTARADSFLPDTPFWKEFF